MGPLGHWSFQYLRIQLVLFWSYWLFMKNLADLRISRILRAKSLQRSNHFRKI